MAVCASGTARPVPTPSVSTQIHSKRATKNDGHVRIRRISYCASRTARYGSTRPSSSSTGWPFFGTHAFKSCPPMGDSRLRDHHHTATAQADAPAQVRGFGERAEPWIGTLPSTQGGQWNQRAGKRHSQHILPAIILFLIRLTVHHQRRDIVMPRIQTDVMQLSACQSNCSRQAKTQSACFSKHRATPQGMTHRPAWNRHAMSTEHRPGRQDRSVALHEPRHS